jgi:hypothetical protein
MKHRLRERYRSRWIDGNIRWRASVRFCERRARRRAAFFRVAKHALGGDMRESAADRDGNAGGDQRHRAAVWPEHGAGGKARQRISRL